MGCGCLIALATLLSPRLALFILLLVGRLSEVFTSFWIGLIGFLFLPWTALAWAVAFQVSPLGPSYAPGVTGFGWFVVALGVVFDISSYTSSERARRQRAERV